MLEKLREKLRSYFGLGEKKDIDVSVRMTVIFIDEKYGYLDMMKFETLDQVISELESMLVKFAARKK